MIVVEHHHEVLPAWAELRARLPEAPRLLSLDHHTDTVLPFRRHVRVIAAAEGQQLCEDEEAARSAQLVGEIRDVASATRALETLANDEHVRAALGADILSAAFVIAHKAMDTDLEVFAAHRIACRAVDETIDASGRACLVYDNVLEDDFLRPRLAAFDRMLEAAGEPPLRARPFVLDVDLDVFNTWAAVRPRSAELFATLAREAALITVATEPSFVRHCARDHGLTAGALLAELTPLLPD